MRDIIIAWAVCASLAFFPAHSSAQSPINSFPPGAFQNQAALSGAVSSAPMTTPILISGPNITGPNTGTAQYLGLGGGYTTGWASTEGQRKTPTPIPGTFTTLIVKSPNTTVSSNKWTFTLRKNAVATALTCTIDGAAPADNCSITTNVTAAAGDYWDIQSCPGVLSGGTCSVGSAPTALTNLSISLLFTGTNNNEGMLLGSGTTSVSTSVTNYIGYTVTATAGTSDDSAVSNIIADAGVIDNLYCEVNTAPGSGKSWTVTLVKNGVDQSVVCVIQDANTTGTSVGGTNTPITYAANDTISTKWVPSGTPAAPANQNFATRWQPTTQGNAILFYTSNATNIPATAGTKFVALNGAPDGNTENGLQQVAPGGMHIKTLSAKISAGPNNGSSQTRILTLRDGAANQSVTCTFSGSNAGTDTCADGTHSYSAASATSLLNWAWTLTGTPASVNWSKIGAVVTVP